MNLQSVFYILFTISLGVFAADPATTTSTSTSVSKTLVWVTGTDEHGARVTTQSIYTQQFEVLFTVVASPSSGSIGPGSISGDIGEIRTYQLTTITNSAPSILHKFKTSRPGSYCIAEVLTLTTITGLVYLLFL
ncbi:uncharacterized protein RJT20DRAFT_10840 [Scheffersomyces xylosifermentans]|uniref:uncharacterized protein n=1 Tax=Scheffersomyces xylosifermentans TaxID=1304137 RepID=UPI00315D75AA